MKTAWQVRRTPVPQEDGERRWEYAYQFLLQRAIIPGAGKQSAPAQQQEASLLESTGKSIAQKKPLSCSYPWLRKLVKHER